MGRGLLGWRDCHLGGGGVVHDFLLVGCRSWAAHRHHLHPISLDP